MQYSGAGENARAGREATHDDLLRRTVPSLERLDPADQQRLRQMAAELRERGMPESFVATSLKSTADVMLDLREEERHENVFHREDVQRFIEQNAVSEAPQRYSYRRERKREERERMHATASQLIREARLARGRHEVKKTRNMLLKIDQRELRRILGQEGDDLCRQINTWLRSTAGMF